MMSHLYPSSDLQNNTSLVKITCQRWSYLMHDTSTVLSAFRHRRVSERCLVNNGESQKANVATWSSGQPDAIFTHVLVFSTRLFTFRIKSMLWSRLSTTDRLGLVWKSRDSLLQLDAPEFPFHCTCDCHAIERVECWPITWRHFGGWPMCGFLSPTYDKKLSLMSEEDSWTGR